MCGYLENILFGSKSFLIIWVYRNCLSKKILVPPPIVPPNDR